MRMKTVTVKQPWAGLIAAGAKSLEIRSWSTAHRGHLAIHAGRTLDESAATRIVWPHGVKRDLPDVRGAIVACVDLLDVVPFEPIMVAAACIPWRPGLYAWRLGNVFHVDDPVPAQGKQGLWEWDAPSDLKGTVIR